MTCRCWYDRGYHHFVNDLRILADGSPASVDRIRRHHCPQLTIRHFATSQEQAFPEHHPDECSTRRGHEPRCQCTHSTNTVSHVT